MAIGRPKAALVLSEREQLDSMATARSLPAGLVNRVRIILMSASGKTNQEIARRLGPANATVGKWRRRFLERDVTGLHDELRPGRPRSIGDERAARLVRKTLETKTAKRHALDIRQIARQKRCRHPTCTASGRRSGCSHTASGILSSTTIRSSSRRCETSWGCI